MPLKSWNTFRSQLIVKPHDLISGAVSTRPVSCPFELSGRVNIRIKNDYWREHGLLKITFTRIRAYNVPHLEMTAAREQKQINELFGTSVSLDVDLWVFVFRFRKNLVSFWKLRQIFPKVSGDFCFPKVLYSAKTPESQTEIWTKGRDQNSEKL